MDKKPTTITTTEYKTDDDDAKKIKIKSEYLKIIEEETKDEENTKLDDEMKNEETIAEIPSSPPRHRSTNVDPLD